MTTVVFDSTLEKYIGAPHSNSERAVPRKTPYIYLIFTKQAKRA